MMRWKCLRKAAELDNDNPHAWCLLASAYNELNLEEAVVLL